MTPLSARYSITPATAGTAKGSPDFMNRPIRIGMVGLGVIAETHLQVLAELQQVALDFTVDPYVKEPASLRERTSQHYSRLENALDAHQPDLVVIATPTDTHADLAAQAVTQSSARVLVEKPLVHDLNSLTRLRVMDESADVSGRVFTAHHFAFSPEVLWAAEQISQHLEWGPITSVTSAFYDPYILLSEQAFASYGSSWMDSGVNQLSMLARFVKLTALTSAQQLDDGASAWCTCEYHSQGITGIAKLRTSWLTGSSSKKTTLTFGHSGVELWIDHTAMAGFVAHNGTLLATHDHDGQTPRKITHYKPLYESLLSAHPDPILNFETAATLTELHHTTNPAPHQNL